MPQPISIKNIISSPPALSEGEGAVTLYSFHKYSFHAPLSFGEGLGVRTY